MAQLVALPGRAPVHIINQDFAGLDGFSLGKAFKKLTKLAKKGLDPISKALLKKDPITGKLLKDKKKKKPKAGIQPGTPRRVVRVGPGMPLQRPHPVVDRRRRMLMGKEPKILLQAGRFEEGLQGLDGFSLGKAFKKLTKLAKKGLDPISKAILKKDPITGKLLKTKKKKKAAPKPRPLGLQPSTRPKVAKLPKLRGRVFVNRPRPFVIRNRPLVIRDRATLTGGEPRILLQAGRFEEGLQGLDGFSLKKIGKSIGKGLKKVGKFIDKNKWYIAGAATAAYGGWALASKAAAGKLAAGAGAKAAAGAVAKKAGTSLLSKVGGALLKGGKKVAEAATPLVETVGTQMLQNAVAPQPGMEAYGMQPYGMDPYGLAAQGYGSEVPMEAAMAQGGWGGGGLPEGGSGLPGWVLPVAIGGGVLLLVMSMSSRK